MASPEDVAAAFDRVDALLVAAKETAPSVAWLVDRAAANGICEDKLANHGDFQESCHSLAAIQAAWIKGSAISGSGSSVGLFIHTSAG